MPTELRDSTFKDKVQIKTYPTAEYGGCVWIYMGPEELQPALPQYEWTTRGENPKLRVYIMHAGYPMIDDMLAVLYAHPQVYVDVGVIVYTQPRPAFYRYLQAIVDEGAARRRSTAVGAITGPPDAAVALHALDVAASSEARLSRVLRPFSTTKLVRVESLPSGTLTLSTT